MTLSELLTVDRLISRRDLQDVLGVSAPKLHELHRTGKGPRTVKVGSTFHYFPDDVRAWLERGGDLSADDAA